MGRRLTVVERNPRIVQGGKVWWYPGKGYCVFCREGLRDTIRISTKELRRGLFLLSMGLGKQKARRPAKKTRRHQ